MFSASRKSNQPLPNSQRNILLGGIIGLIVIIAIGIAFVQLAQPQNADENSYQTPKPEEVVRQYFESWSKKDWPNMYATISDGFKRIDPNAKDLAAFRNFASAQGIEGINILSIKELSNDGTTASVDYSVEFTFSDGSKRKFDDTFTLKFRQADIIPGWKLIHPYGPNVDTS